MRRFRVKGRLVIASALGAVAAAGCSLLVDLSGLSGAADGGVAEEEGGRDGGPDGARDALRPLEASLDGAGRAACANAEAGPLLVDAGGYCIDATEVTQGQYSLFLSTFPQKAKQVPECLWNTSFTPLPPDFQPVLRKDKPVVGVSWCDAYEYCRWAGKRLCGRIGGGPLAPTERSSATKSQWFGACADGDDRTFPYGSTFEAGACNTDEAEAGAVALVGKYAGCEGAPQGVFDMSGNAGEWTDDCEAEAPDGAATACGRHGGSYVNKAGLATCSSTARLQRHASDSTTGFRCCAD